MKRREILDQLFDKIMSNADQDLFESALDAFALKRFEGLKELLGQD